MTTKRAHVLTSFIQVNGRWTLDIPAPVGTQWAMQNPLMGYDEIPAENIPNAPNLAVCEFITPNGADIDALGDDVIWRNPAPGPDQHPTPEQRGKLINALKARGVPANEAAALVIAGQTAGRIGQNIAAYAKSRPKGNSGKAPNGK